MVRRIIFWVVILLAVGGCFALGFGWGQSWRYTHTWTWVNGGEMWELRSDRGQLSLAQLSTHYLPEKTYYHIRERVGHPAEECCPSNMPVHRWAGFDYSAVPWTTCGGRTRAWFVGVPFALPMALLILVPLWGLACLWRRMRQRQRVVKGLCVKCGYDLRATPERCPECGLKVGNTVR
jgi:hypothetical protein